MGHHRQHYFPLLATLAAATVASAQAQQPAPAADVPAVESERPNVSDARLGLEVQARLIQLDISGNLSAIVRQGVATLDGVVPTDEIRKRAEELALEVHGVDSVINDLTVATPATVAIAEESAALAEREAANIETEVAKRLQSDPVLGSRPIVVEADELTNTVTLLGTVTTEEEKRRAGEIAVTAFPGGQVRNQLDVRQRL